MSVTHQVLKCHGMKVFVTRNLPSVAMEILEKAGLNLTQWCSDKPVSTEELKLGVRNVDGLYCLLTDRISEEVLEAAGDQLKVVSTMSVGFEHIDRAACKRRGIRVGYTPDVLTDDTAELAVALLLATSRRLFEANGALVRGECGAWSPLWMCGSALRGSTVGIVGLGRIGFEIAKRLQGFKVSRFLYSSRRKNSNDKEVNAEHVTLEELLKSSDFIIVSCSLTIETNNLFTLEKFQQMKPSSIFINISRGAVVNQDDLHSALTKGIILAAGLDVTTPEPLPSNHPLLLLSNCVVLPHIGSATLATRREMAELAAENLVRGLSGLPMPAELDLEG